jgi:ABC-type nitrate/sulfonate/bicarbonate transport system permease component
LLRDTLPGVLLLLAVWQVTAMGITHARGVAFPTPWTTCRRLGSLLAGTPLLDASIYRHVGDSLGRWALGFALAMGLGLLGGLMAGAWRWGGRLLLPTIQLVQLVPGLAWIPLALLLFGIGPRATVFMIAITAMPPIALSVVGGVRHVDPSYVRAARMMGAGQGTLLFRVLLPAALPQILTGLRVGLGNAWRVLVAGEKIVGTGTGLGYAILQARWTLDYASAFACIAIIGVLGLTVERGVFGPLERLVRRRWGRLGED